jgi:hypothetical protein
VPDEHGLREARLLDGLPDVLDHLVRPVRRARVRPAVAGEVEGERPAAGIAGAELVERRPPHEAIERQPVQQDEGRPAVVVPARDAGQSGEPLHAADRVGVGGLGHAVSSHS